MMLGLAFTVGADYLLILRNAHHFGVVVFCFAHMAYILRALCHAPGKWRRLFPGLTVIVVGLVYLIMALFVLDWLNWINAYYIVSRIVFSIYIVAALYATLFVTNIYLSARYIRHNRVLVITGLLLFAACDIFVLLFNLPFYFGAPAGLTAVFPLIWVFYLPSQALLGVSAVAFSRVCATKP